MKRSSLSALVRSTVKQANVTQQRRRLSVLLGLFFLFLISAFAAWSAPKWPTVTINQAVSQADPTSGSPINFTVVFSSPVTGFTNGDVTITGTAGGTKTVVVTGSGANYNVAVSGMTSTGTVVATIAAGVAQDASGNTNKASSSTDNTVTFDVTRPTVTINQASGQADPTSSSSINFTVVFSEAVTGFTNADVTLSGTAGANTVAVSGSGTTYNVAVSGMTVTGGTVIATIPANAAQDSVGNLNTASTSTDNSVTYDLTSPTVTINQASGQADPTSASPINFTVVFSEPVTGFTNTDVTLSGTAGANTVVVSGSGATYNVAVSGMTASGTVIATIPAGAAQDSAGITNTASTSTDNSVTYNKPGALTVTIDQAAGQPDPTNASTINFTAVFSSPVTGFTSSDVVLSGTANGQRRVTVTDSGDHRTYGVQVTKMTNGTVIASIPANAAQDAGLTGNAASTSTDNVVTYDTVAPTVTINQSIGQSDPSKLAPINFTVVFSEAATGFTNTDVTLSGTAGATTAVVTGSGTTYNVAVSGMTGNGTVIATIGAGVAQDLAGNNNTASTSTDNSVTYDATAPTVTVNQANAQADPTNASPINFTVTFSESVTGFTNGDVTLSGTAGATTAAVTGSGTTYNVAVSGMTSQGTVIATIGAGVAQDAAGNGNAASTSTDNSVTYDATAPSVTINQASGQTDPTNASPINFTVNFSESVTGFTNGDVTLSGTAGATTAVVTGSGSTYNVAVSGMTAAGNVTVNIPAGAAQDGGGNGSTASTSTDNSVAYDATAPTVTINQAAAQADPTNTSPINFTVTFSEAVTGFTNSDVTLSGTAGATTAVVTGSGATYNVAVSGMTADGNVTVTIPAGAAQDDVGNESTASTSTDNSVAYDATALTATINQTAAQADPTNSSPINFTVVFSKSVSDFATGDVTLSGTAGATTATVTGSGTTYNVAVSGMSADGTVTASLAADVAHDAVGNGNTASTSSDNSVSYDATPLTVTINQAAAQVDPTNSSPINFTVVFNKPVTDFATGDVTLSGTAGATTATVTGSGTTYNVAVSGMTADGAVSASLAADVAHDAASNGNTASTSSDNSVGYDATALTVTIEQAAAQADPTNSSPINFTVVFSKPVTDFATGDVTLGGTAGATTATVTGSDTTYNVAVSGMSADGTVSASLAADVAHDAASNGNTASTSTDNSVSYTTTPPAVTRFAVIGDYGCHCQSELDVANLVKSWDPEFIITTGDNNYDFGEASTIDPNIGQYYHEFIYPYLGSYGAGADTNRFFPTLGNHDWGDGFIDPPSAGVQPYLDYFTLPGNERYYDFVRGPLHFFVIDSEDYEPDGNTSTSIQANWLHTQLAASTEPWKLVYFHYPPYSSGAHGSFTKMQWPFQAWGATAVLNGHDHDYERVTQGNFVYFVNGLGGEDKSLISKAISGSQKRFDSDFGAMLVTASTDSITFEFITRTGTLIDRYIIYTNPSVHPTVAPSALTATQNCASEIRLAWADNASNEDGYRIEQSTDGTNFSEIGTVAANVTSYVATNLLPSSTYYYRVDAFNAVGTTTFSNIANASTSASSSIDPSNLTAATTSSSRITLSWTDNICSELGFKIERSPDGVNFTQIGTVAANVTTYLDTGLTISTTYYYQVRAFSAQGDSNYSNVAIGVTGGPPPAAPSGLTATAVSSSQIDLSWADNSSDEDSFRIYRSTDNINFFWYLTAGANATTFSDTGKTAATTYYYRVKAHNPGGESPPSNTANATTFGPPSAASNLTATAISASQINLSWTDNSSDEDGFKIYRSTDNVNFAFYATVGANVTTRSNTNLSSGTTYYYRVLAYNAGGSSGYSNVANATTFSLPATPTNLTATAVSSSQIDLTWVDNSNDETNFRIYRSTNGVNFVFTYNLGPNVTSFSDTGRTAGTTYYYQVAASNSNGISAFSNTVSATTFPLPAAPTNLTAVAISSSRIDLAWTDNSNNEDGFKIYRSTDNVNWVFYFAVGANVTTRSNTNLSSGTTYYYRVFAYNSGGNSANSNVASATTLP
jgi:hypothetical protein